MSTNIKIKTERNGEFIESSSEVIRFILPNGDEYVMNYSKPYDGIELIKVDSENTTTISILPCVSNKIIIK